MYEGKSVALALGSTKTIVDYGTVVTTKNILHGAPIPKDCLCVSIDEVVDEDAPLPFPIQDISDIVGECSRITCGMTFPIRGVER